MLSYSFDGSLWGMGRNSQLGIGNTHRNKTTPIQIVSKNVIAIEAGYKHSIFIKDSGLHNGKKLRGTWGWNYHKPNTENGLKSQCSLLRGFPSSALPCGASIRSWKQSDAVRISLDMKTHKKMENV